VKKRIRRTATARQGCASACSPKIIFEGLQTAPGGGQPVARTGETNTSLDSMDIVLKKEETKREKGLFLGNKASFNRPRGGNRDSHEMNGGVSANGGALDGATPAVRYRVWKGKG